MTSTNLKIGVILLFQMIIGILGNFSLLCHYIFLYLSGCRSRSTDFILRHLTVANILVILSRGIPETMVAFGLENFLSDFGCILVFYVHWVGKGVSFGSTCLLSVFQAIIISPRNSKWSDFKVKAPKYVSNSNILCWILHLLVNLIASVHVTGKLENTNITMKTDFGYCSTSFLDEVLYSLSAALLSIPDVLCLGLMLWASGSMVFILHRHKQRVQHIHSTNVSSRSSPETRAAHSILVLVSTFVCFYTLSFSIRVCLAFFYDSNRLLITLSALINACFPTVCPFVLMSRECSVF
ncbi:vomeronasal type-1 receptor 4-like [Cynocephalus volans]|uniref:vomeronasal type-1 receptor 4-like n=1 Tax=Cynocephalus volans TaxID=110931 RepID=UPI002FCB6F0E